MIWIILTIAVTRKWQLRKLDVSNAFLHRVLEEDMYMRQPPGFKDISNRDYVCKLQKSIYELKQFPRAWFSCLRDFLISLKFTESLSDRSLFIFTDGNFIAYFLIYVIDMIPTVSSDVLQILSRNYL